MATSKISPDSRKRSVSLMPLTFLRYEARSPLAFL
jgi:hypothetical protein